MFHTGEQKWISREGRPRRNYRDATTCSRSFCRERQTVNAIKKLDVECNRSNPVTRRQRPRDFMMILPTSLKDRDVVGANSAKDFAEEGMLYQTSVAMPAKSTYNFCPVKWSSTPILLSWYLAKNDKFQTSCSILCAPYAPWSYWPMRLY